MMAGKEPKHLTRIVVPSLSITVLTVTFKHLFVITCIAVLLYAIDVYVSDGSVIAQSL
jgi:hypothetical protein